MTDLANIPRDSRRVPLETRVQFKFDRFSGFLSDYSANISPGGMFIRSQDPQDIGTTLDFEFRLGDGYELIRGRGEVTWVRPYDEGPRRPAGMGIRFLELSDGSLDLIYKIVDQHVLQGGTPFDVLKEPQSSAPSAFAPPAESLPAGAGPRPRDPAEIALDDSILTMHGFERRPGARDAEPPQHLDAEPESDARSWMPHFEDLEAPVSRPSLPPFDFKSPDEAADDAWSPPVAPPPSYAPNFGAASAADEEGNSRRILRAVLVVGGFALVAMAYLYRDRVAGWFGVGGGEDIAIKTGVRPDLAHGAVPSEAATSDLARSGGADANPSPAAPDDQPVSGAAGAPPAVAPSVAAPVVPPPVASRPVPPSPAPPSRPQSVPAPVQPAQKAPSKPAPADASPNPLVEAKGFSALEKVTFEKGPSGTDVFLWLDGGINASRYSRSDLGGPAPRILIKLRGVKRDFPGGRVAIGTPEVTSVRTGYHGEGGLNELHVVIDLARSGIVVTRVEEQPRRLRIHLQRK